MKKSLKTLVAVVIAALTFGLTGCQKDNEDLIVGTWNAYAMSETISNATNPAMNGTHEDELMSGMSMTLTFNKDNTGVMVTTFSLFGMNETEQDTFTYTIDGDKLTMVIKYEDGETETTVSTIEKLDKKELWITESGHDQDWDDDDNPYEYDYTGTIKYKKA